MFFDSLAADRGEHAIGIVLSGSGSDGTLGIKAIKEHGGLTHRAGHRPPRPAPRQHAGQRHRHRAGRSGAAGRGDRRQAGRLRPQLACSTDRAGHEPCRARPRRQRDRGRAPRDLRHPARAGRARFQRLQGKDLPAPGAAADAGAAAGRRSPPMSTACARTPTRSSLLFRDLLIGVTAFFRDPDAFAALEQTVIPQLFAGQGAGRRGAGVGSGLRHRRGGLLDRDPAARAHGRADRGRREVQVFGTDIDEAALDRRPRRAAIPRRLLEDVSPERLRRFFVRGRRQLRRWRKEVRDICIFSAHSLIRDPPFSRLDLISCRNLLIYLDADLQTQRAPDLPLRAAARRLPVPRRLGERRRGMPTCSTRRQASTASSSAATDGGDRSALPLLVTGPRLVGRLGRRPRAAARPLAAVAAPHRREPACWSASRRPMSW